MNTDDAQPDHPGDPIQLPELHVVLTGRRRAVIDGATALTTLDDVVAGIGPRATGRRITVDDRVVAGSQRLQHSGIRRGSRIDFSGPASPAVDPAECVVSAVWVRGVDAGGRSQLTAGRHFLGRARAASVRCDDQAIELHHAIVDVGADGSVVVSQLAGLHPVLVDGAAIDGPRCVQLGQRVEVGASVLTFRAIAPSNATAGARESAIMRRSTDPWRMPWVRSPRQRSTFAPQPIEAPRPTAPPSAIHGGVLPAIIGVAGAAALALLFDQVMFLLFGAMGALVALGTWLAQRVGLIRSRRAAGFASRSAMDAFVEMLSEQRDTYRRALLAGAVTIERAVAMMHARSGALWSVRATDDDAFRVSIGEAEGSWQPLVTGVSDPLGDRRTSRSFRTGNDRRDVIDAIENASRLGTVPVSASLGSGEIVAVVGAEEAFAVARSMIVQMAATSGPADWHLLLVSDRPDEWSGLEWLPHLAGARGDGAITPRESAAEVVAALDPNDPRHLLVVLDDAELLSARTGPLRRLLAGSSSAACVAVCATEAEVPAVCTSVLAVARRGAARWIADVRAGSLSEPVHISGISAAGAFDAAASIACLLDPELAHGASALPAEVGLIDLLGADIGREPRSFAAHIAERWAGNGPDPAPSTPIGRAADGVIEIDLRRDGPHALIAGTTGAGKSELLRSLVIGIAARCSPDEVTFVLVDYKGGSTFDACVALPHTVGMVTDLDERLAARALRSLDAELRRREVMLRAVGVGDLASYRVAVVDGAPPPTLPRLVVVIDEFAGLVVQQPAFISALLGVAQRGRSLGVHLLLATQRPHGVISDDIRANTNLRIALRVQDPADSTDIVGEPTAAYLSRSTPGRAVMRLGTDELIDFQTATCTTSRRGAPSPAHPIVRTFDSISQRRRRAADAPDVAAGSDLDVLVEAIRGAARIVGTGAPHRPWLDPLSTGMGLDALPAGEVVGITGCDAHGDRVVGVVDDPDRQTRRALTWPRESGHLLLLGSPGSGTTTALVELAAALAGPDAAAQLFVIDANGDQLLDLVRGFGNCPALVRVHEGERLLRVLDHLCNAISARRANLSADAGGDRREDIVVMIDGLAALRTELSQGDQWRQLDQLERIVAEGPAAGIRVAITAERAGAVPSAMLGHIARRWVFHLADPSDAAALGLSPAIVPAAAPGRLFDTAAMTEAQVIRRADPARSPGERGPSADTRDVAEHDRLGELAADIDVSSLAAAVAEGGDVLAPIGIAFDDLRPAVLPIAAGEHVLVIGPSRSGRTTALGTIADRWSTAHATGWIGSIARRRSGARPGTPYRDVAELFAAMPDDRPVLVVIDDAELVDDPTGVLTARAGAHGDHFTVVAAGRGEGLRTNYGHWSATVRRSRLGVVMAAANDLDGDLLGATLPRRLPIPARPGLAWLIADGDQRLVQIAHVLTRTAPAPVLR